MEDHPNEKTPLNFAHLHVHTRYSILDGASQIPQLIDRVKELGMNSIAITDHGNMYGVMEFISVCEKKGVKPIIGCEVYVAVRGRHQKTERIDQRGYHLILLAKNIQGYHNLCMLNTLSFQTDAFYYTPRIDRELLEQYHEGLIACSACLGGEIPKKILSEREDELKEALMFYKNLFGEDYYLELQNHGHEEQIIVNKRLLELSQEYNIKCIATNDLHFVNKEDRDAHKILVCLNTGKKLNEVTQMVYTGEEYLKSPEEMLSLFPDHPELLANTCEIAEKVEVYKITRDILIPKFPLPEGFENEMEYLRYLTYQGATERYGENYAPEIRERIDFELDTIERMGFPGYFLIVWDFIDAARKMGVSVGLGRGSAAGSAIAYCLKITGVDPLHYNLLFERFLNPERISMPDIDVDFDDENREKVIQYVIGKYGADQFAQIITYGSMASKSAIKDVARVLDVPLEEANALVKLIDEYEKSNDKIKNLKQAYEVIPEFKKKLEDTSNPIISKTLKFAAQLEGSIRSTGVHACGMIIAPDNLSKYVPLCTAKDSSVPVTQYEGTYIESSGLLKMDFLGLTTLSIIRDTLKNIKKRHGIDIDLNTLPLNDESTYALFSRGETDGIFQFESPGMKKYLKELQPSKIEDLIAMNALYRPGPMEYIPNYIRRKHGEEPIDYELPGMEEYLAETYGVTVYQEQVMLLSQKLANFTKGEGDQLRKAMGKKKKDLLDQLKIKFLDGCKKNGHEEKIVQHIWEDWEKFASYAFNKSHATCYAYLAYQTGYLKAHYPAEFMAALLSHNINDISKLSFYLEECKQKNIPVKGPDINKSEANFSVEEDGSIRLGLHGLKNVGERAVINLIEEREKKPFDNIRDFLKRVDLSAMNKRCMEALIKAGAFDCFPQYSRADYFAKKKDKTLLDALYSDVSNTQYWQQNLFGESENFENEMELNFPKATPWSLIEQLQHEKEVTGICLSGHPLDGCKWELSQFSNCELNDLKDLDNLHKTEVFFGGYVVQAERDRVSKKGNPYTKIVLEDYNGSFDLMLFGKENCLKFQHFASEGEILFVEAKVEENPYARYHKDKEKDDKQSPQKNLRIINIRLIEDVISAYTSKVEISLPIENLTSTVTEAFQTALSHHLIPADTSLKGKEGVEVEFIIHSPKDKMSLKMPVTNGRVDAKAFLKDIENIREIQTLRLLR